MFNSVKNALLTCFVGLALTGCTTSQSAPTYSAGLNTGELVRGPWIFNSTGTGGEQRMDVRNRAGYVIHTCQVVANVPTQTVTLRHWSVGSEVSTTAPAPIAFELTLSAPRAQKEQFLAVCGRPPLKQEILSLLAS